MWVSAIHPVPTVYHSHLSLTLSPSLSLSLFHCPVCLSLSSPKRHNALVGCQSESSGTGKCEVGERAREGGERKGAREPCCKESFPLPAGQEDVLVQYGGC